MPRSIRAAITATSAAPAATIEPAATAVTAVSKAEAVRKALDAGLVHAAQAIPWIRENVGLEMTAQHFSSVKSQLKRRELGGKSTDIFGAIDTINTLVSQYGTDNIKRILDLRR